MPAPPRKKKAVPSPAETPAPPRDVATIDAWFATAGLVRSRRDKPANIRSRARFQEKAPEDLRPKPAITSKSANGVEIVAVPGWKKLPWLWHGFSTRRGGVSLCYTTEGSAGELNLGLTADDERENVLRNRQLLAEAVTGDAATPLVTLRQVHSSVVVVAGGEGGAVCKGDGLMTDRPGLLLGIQTADCVPVLLADRRRKVVAAFHAGWRGTVRRIVETGIGRMRLEFGCRPEDLTAAIGPSIGPCCYAVGEEVMAEFDSQFAYAGELFHEVYETDSVRQKYPMLFLTQRAPGHSPMGPSLHLDVAEANRRQLLAAGLKTAAIHSVGGCTNCQRELFFSHRGSQGRCGRMMSVIGVRQD